MISTGNDIVSINAINPARTNQYKFYSKILSDPEKLLYKDFSLTGIPFENFVWLLWSIKESAYKFLQRNDPDLIFTPIKFVVKKLQLPADFSVKSFNAVNIEGKGFGNFSCVKGVISFGSCTLCSSSLLYNELITTVVNHEDNFENICWGVKCIDAYDNENQSKEVRLLLLDRLRLFYKDSSFTITKNQYGCPLLLKDSIELATPVSLSHHKEFVAYSFQLIV